MKILPLRMRGVWLSGLLLAGAVRAGEEKVVQAVAEKKVTLEFQDGLVAEDVPAIWKVERTEKPGEQRTVVTYKRGGVRVLEVTTLEARVLRPRGQPRRAGREDPKMFVALFYHGDVLLARLDNLGVEPSAHHISLPAEYSLNTSVKDGALTSMAWNEEGTFWEKIVVNAQEARPLDDLEYTRFVLSFDKHRERLLKSAGKQAAPEK